MARVNGFKGVSAVLKNQADRFKGEGKPVAVVGYTQHYAIWVHENLTAHHPIGKAKFLEGPARRLGKELMRMVSTGIAKGLSVTQSLTMAGLRLQRESQKECPVDTGALRNSAFTRIERG